MSLSLDPNIFRAYDIRGIVDQALTVEAVTAIGQALAGMAAEKGEKAIAVCRDGRLSGPKLVDALASGIQSGGLDVIDLGMNPTPVGYFGAATLDETNSCVVVTGSHNPPDYNGLKMVVAGETISGERIQEIRQRIEARNLPSGEGNRSSVDLTEAYLNRIVSDIEVARPMKVVVDCGNGAAAVAAPE
ncbi:MAG: phosphomannomutase/phosphoglucomutase, partial [Gammaproteobacteria bacterium]